MSERDVGVMAGSFADWYRAQHPGVTDVEVAAERVRGAGYSSDVVFMTVTASVDGEPRVDELVVRMRPTGPTLFQEYDLGMQAAVHDAVHAGGVPVPVPTTYEADERWLGTPFLVMPRVRGHIPGQLAAMDDWVLSLGEARQATMAASFVEVLAAIHRTPWQGTALAGVLRGAGATLADEVAWWATLAEATFAGAVPGKLRTMLDWCRDHVPDPEPPASVLWGDVRLGNVIFDDAAAPRAVLDWEMASIGPAELDIAWFTALETMSEQVAGCRIPGFPEQAALLAAYEERLGRPLIDLAWFEAFALCRAAMLSIRTDVLAAARKGREPAPADDHFVLCRALDLVEAIDR